MNQLCLLFFSLILLNACNPQEKRESLSDDHTVNVSLPELNLEQANNLATLPFECIEVEYPNKLNQVIGGQEDLQSPKELHPAFYGCFDWHSSVHGHWSLVSLLKQFPELNNSSEIEHMIRSTITSENIIKEIQYFDTKHNQSFERTYGWAWLLKLAEELQTWDTAIGKSLTQNLQPLTNLICDKYVDFLPKLKYPIRVGEHTNTAFGLTFAWDYANSTNNKILKELIEKRAKEFYMNDVNCPLSWEPSGYDFLSPCLQEAAIMKRVLSKDEFNVWFSNFLPQLKDPNFKLAVGEVTDRTDGKLVHLDGVNFSRAWCLYTITKDMPEYDHLKNVANEHINYSLPNLIGDSYEGGHWLGSFAIYALNTAHND